MAMTAGEVGMAFFRRVWCGVAVSAGVFFSALPIAQAEIAPANGLSGDARTLTQWVLATRDHQGQPFAIVDKRNARLFVFDGLGHLLGAAPALLGSAPGDQSAPGVGLLAPARIPAAQRTTPAGRFASEPGRNIQGEDIVWFDYDAALAIHRLRPAPRQEQRPERMASANPDEHRISLGCVVVPVAFYESVVRPVLGRQAGVIYVMPESQPVQALFKPRTLLAALTPTNRASHLAE